MDLLEISLTSAGVVGVGLISLAFNKPNDYLDVVDPILGWITLGLAGLTIGCFCGAEWTLAALESSLDPIKSNVAINKARSLGPMLLLSQLILVGFGVFTQVLAWKMRSRERSRTQSE
jgi:hypothetical protein